MGPPTSPSGRGVFKLRNTWTVLALFLSFATTLVPCLSTRKHTIPLFPTFYNPPIYVPPILPRHLPPFVGRPSHRVNRRRLHRLFHESLRCRRHVGWGKPVAARCGVANKNDGKITLYAGAEEGTIHVELCIAYEILEAILNDPHFITALSI
ncbi:putative acetyltransferase [Senna tora]|uniref:Putative acetyltransferase n=1 Tax=Senna tora TaxID=362788 RepID=A0A835CNI8_9FABA|nr:putative acetyltransferase [Senna tora]